MPSALLRGGDAVTVRDPRLGRGHDDGLLMPAHLLGKELELAHLVRRELQLGAAREQRAGGPGLGRISFRHGRARRGREEREYHH